MVFWDRVTLKLRAKQVLTKSYWMSFVVMLIYGLGAGFFAGSSSSAVTSRANLTMNGTMDSIIVHAMSVLLPFIGVVFLASVLIGVAYYAFVGGILEIGKNRFFTLCRYNTVSLDEMFFGFKNGMYMSNVKTMCLKYLYTFLWSLLFVIPGIVKGYSYSMVPYILAENPTISANRAFEISMQVTQNEKWNMFILDFSFIGWYLLGILACGVGVIFVYPYHEAAKAELYGAMRYKAVTTGVCEKTEIGAEL